MKQIMIKNYGQVGRDQAQAFCRKAKCQAEAYWVQRKRPLMICKMEKLSGDSPMQWQEDVGGLWWSATLTVKDKARKDGLI